MNATSISPLAIQPMTFSERMNREPSRPFTRTPMSGSSGMSQKISSTG